MIYQEIAETIQKSQKITLVTHIDPDGDTLGSALALYHHLQQNGKRVKIYNATTPLPYKYDFLPGYEKIRNHFSANSDLVISFDCGSFRRLGIEKGDYTLINIDHHTTNEHFGDLNLVKPDLPSTSAVVYELLEHLPYKIDRRSALCIYTALAEDTDFFSDATTDASAFGLAQTLVQKGADPQLVGRNLKERNSLARLRLEALFIDNMELRANAQIAIGEVTQEMLKKSGSLRYDTAHLADVLYSLATVKLAIFMITDAQGSVKFSLRSKGIDVAKIAMRYGGGGHRDSAGFQINDSEKSKILDKIIGALNL